MRKHSNRKRLSSWERDQKYKRHLRKLASLSKKTVMYGGADCVEGEDHQAGKAPYYRRYWRGCHNNRFRYWLTISNRKVRRYKGEIPKGGAYRKIFDYWWTVD